MTTYRTGNPIGSADPRDLYDNAENLDEAVNSDDLTFRDRLGNTRLTLTGYESAAGSGDVAIQAAARALSDADRAEAQADRAEQEVAEGISQGVSQVTDLATAEADRAEAEADRAEAARDAAQLTAGIYESASAGLSATSDGDYFSVPSGEDDEYLILYRNVSQSANEIKRYPAAGAVDALRNRASEIGFVETRQPNQFSLDQLAFITPPDFGGTFEVVNYDGLPALKTGPSSSSGIIDTRWSFPVSLFPSGRISTSLTIVSLTEGTSGRFRLTFRDSSNSVIGTSDVGTVLMAGAVTQPVVLNHVGVQVPAGASSVDFQVYHAKTSGDPEREAVIRGMGIFDGSVPVYREPDESAPDLVLSYWPNDDLTSENTSRYDATSYLEDGEAVLDLTEGGSGNRIVQYELPATGVLGPGNFVEAAFDCYREGGTSETSLEFRIICLDSNGTDIGRSPAVGPSVEMEYQWRRSGRVIPENTATLQVRLWAKDGVTVAKFRRPVLTTDNEQAYTLNVSSLSGGATASGVSTVYVGPSGDDQNNLGTEISPFATLSRAMQEIGGRGTIAMLPGEYVGQSIDATAVRDVTLVASQPTLGDGVLIRYGTKLDGITKTAGYSKIYQAPASITSQINWVWQDGVPDERTLVPMEERHSLLRGREHRLESCKIVATDANTLNDALAEIDASSDPRCFYDDGTLYFSIQGGGNAAAEDIYIPQRDGLVINSTRDGGAVGTSGVFRASGVSLRYGAVNTRLFRYWELTNISVLGATQNGFDMASVGRLVRCRAGGVGAITASGGDGANTHNFSDIVGVGCYFHDCYDDGESCHNNSNVHFQDSIAEYNGSAGWIPAIGGHGIYTRCISRKNLWRGIKPGGFATTGASEPTDGGVDTTADCYGCISYDEPKGFVGRDTYAKLRAVDCKAVGSSNTGFDCYSITDCGYSGPGDARHSSTIVNNTDAVS